VKKPILNLSKAAEAPKPKKLKDPEDLEASHPKLYQATFEVASGDFSMPVARRYGIPIDQFRRFLQLNGILAARIKNPYQIMAQLQSYMDMEDIVKRASPDKLLDIVDKQTDKMIAREGGVSHRSEVSLTSPLDRKMQEIPIEDLEKYVDTVDAEFVFVD